MRKQIETANGIITISKEDNVVRYFQNGTYQTHIDLNTKSTFGYVKHMYNDIVHKKHKKVLMIGCGGGSLATMLSEHTTDITVVDILPDSFLIAKEYFDMPESIKCIIGCGVKYLNKTKLKYDAIILDAYSETGNIPEAFKKASMYNSINNKLNINGTLYINMCNCSYIENMVSRLFDIDSVGLALICQKKENIFELCA